MWLFLWKNKVTALKIGYRYVTKLFFFYWLKCRRDNSKDCTDLKTSALVSLNPPLMKSDTEIYDNALVMVNVEKN